MTRTFSRSIVEIGIRNGRTELSCRDSTQRAAEIGADQEAELRDARTEHRTKEYLYQNVFYINTLVF